jgi:hypothetical protein
MDGMDSMGGWMDGMDGMEGMDGMDGKYTFLYRGLQNRGLWTGFLLIIRGLKTAFRTEFF